MSPQNETDKLIRNWVRDSGAFVECFEYETLEGETYTLCCDQDGGEWIE